jgi:signal transduction histidine kinase/DNA-binding response OmpR family regulator/HAMP domain-containing protein
MKISYRILLINFAVVAAILVSSAVVIYSVMNKIVNSQQSRYLVNSANSFNFSYRSLVEDCEEEFLLLEKSGFAENASGFQRNTDFIFYAADSLGPLKVIFSSKNAVLPPKEFSINDFTRDNPFALVKLKKSGPFNYYYGRIFNEDLLNVFTKRTGTEIALVWNNTAAEVSNSTLNYEYQDDLSNAYLNLKKDNGTKVYSNNSGLNAVKFSPPDEPNTISRFEFLIFTTMPDSSDLSYALVDVLILVGITGIVLSIILTLIFTDRIRKSIKSLSKSTEVIQQGDFSQKIDIRSKDELGQLGSAFNSMLDVLARNEQQKNEYSEFITLINRNATLAEISDAALRKIIKTCGFTVGALYVTQEDNFKCAAVYGFDKNLKTNTNPELFSTVVKTQEPVEIHLEQDYPAAVSGLVRINIKHLLVIPVIYNSNVIAVIELGSVSKPSGYAMEYLSRIQEQLAIGLTNALALVQLENVVSELKKLNEDYHAQNLQIMKQNETLVALHKELKEKADELSFQKQKAEEATHLKSQFLASMSHELRTPMNSILGLSELILEESVIAGKNRERLEVVLKNGRRLMNLINDILDLSKIEAGKMEIYEEDILLEEIISDVETSVAPLIKNKDIEFQVVRDTNTSVMISTDRGKLMQVLINLLGNAIKFTDHGRVELKVLSPAEDQLQFEVTDTGIGISEADKKIIFDEFRQADGTTTRKYSGSGLGLAISSRICYLLKGSLDMESQLGSGSKFIFTIPFNRSTKQHQAAGHPYSIETLIKNRKNPILIIDDDQEFRTTMGQYLNSQGYDVLFAENGYNGLSEAVERQPFAVILDLMLPNKDGWTTLKELKENPSTKDIPVILISILGDRKVGYGLGAFEYFVKPIASDELLSCLHKMENLAQKRIRNIVIVDDDELEFDKFKNEFKKEKIRIHYIKESELAFSKILELQPDLVIVDLLMPNVDGITLSHKLKSNKDTRHIPIFISTAKEINDLEKDALQSIVENITVKAKGHPLDVLKVVRDRIKMQEMYALDTENEIPELPENGNGNGSSQYVVSEKQSLEVLIVDDDPDALYTLDEIVQSCDCKTILAKDGLECLKVLEEKTPDLVLLDIMMPGMDGFQALKKIRSEKKWDNMPVFAVTAKAMIEDKGIIMKYGFDDYIFKPINAGMLAFKLKKLLFKMRVNH